MTKEMKTLTVYLVMAAVVLVVGIVLGFYIWGVDREKEPDYGVLLARAVEHFTAVERENEALKKELASKEQEIASLTGIIEEGPGRLNEQIRELEAQLAAITTEKEKLQSSLDKAAKVAEKKKALKEEIHNLTEKLKELESRNASLQSAVDASTALREEKERLHLEMEKLKDVNKQLGTALEASMKETEMLEQENERLRNAAADEPGVRELEEKIQDLKSRLESVKRLPAPPEGDLSTDDPVQTQ